MLVVCLFVWGLTPLSTLFHLFNGNSPQIHVSRTIFNQYLISPLSCYWRASRTAIPTILSTKAEIAT